MEVVGTWTGRHATALRAAMRLTTDAYAEHLGVAEERLTSALDRRAPTDAKGRALLTLDLASCLVSAGEYEEAARLTGAALDLASATVVRPILTRATQVRATFRPGQATRAVAELDQRIREATSRTRLAT